MEYHYQLTLASSSTYKELQGKYKAMNEAHRKEKEEKLKVNRIICQILRQKEQELEKYIK